MKRIKSSIIIFLVTILILSAVPFYSYAAPVGSGFPAFTDDFVPSVKSDNDIVKKEDKDKVSIITSVNNARIFVDDSMTLYTIKQYNLLLGKWEDLTYKNNGKFLLINNLEPDSFHRIKISAGPVSLGYYTFVTRPENIAKTKLKVTKKDVTLMWSNPTKYETEIYRQTADPESDEENPNWEKLDTVKASKYVDDTVEGDTYYNYKIRYVCKYKDKKQYSQFKTFEEVFVPMEIDNILEVNGYIIIRQNDPLNRTIPYPYNDNGKTIGSSGCGVCSSLMIIRNLTDYEPTLESYAQEIIDCGGRVSSGSDLNAISRYMKSEYHLNYSYTKSIKELKKHLKKGNMAIANVGDKKLFAKSGHFVVVAGITKDEDGNDLAIILDPSFKPSKYEAKHRVDAGIKYSKDGIVTAPFDVLLEDTRLLTFALYEAE